MKISFSYERWARRLALRNRLKRKTEVIRKWTFAGEAKGSSEMDYAGACTIHKLDNSDKKTLMFL